MTAAAGADDAPLTGTRVYGGTRRIEIAARSQADPGAAARIVQSAGFQAALIAVGLPEGGVGAATSFTNYLVAGSVVSSATGDHIGQSSYLPSLTFSSEQKLTAFLIGLVNPAAGVAYLIGTDQFANKHPSAQVSQGLALLAGSLEGDTPAGAIRLEPKVLDTSPPLTNSHRCSPAPSARRRRGSPGLIDLMVAFDGMRWWAMQELRSVSATEILRFL